MNDYYAILGVARNATGIEIRNAYLKLARDTHPDKVKDREARKVAEDAFKDVTAAYDTLSRERSRREYQSKLGTAEMQAPPRPPGDSAAPSGASAPSSRAGAGPETSRAHALPTSDRIAFDALGHGIEAFRKQDYHTAVQLLNHAVAKDEKNARAHAVLGMALAKNPNWIRNALHHMETAARLEPKNVAYLAELALLLHSQGLKIRARRALDSAIALNPEHPDVVRATKEVPAAPSEPESLAENTAELGKGLLDRLRRR